MKPIEILVDQKALNGEGPVWDDINQLIYWVDILKATIYIYQPATGTNQKLDLSDHFSTIGTVALRQQGGLLIAADRCIATVDLKTRKVEILAEPEAHLPGNRFNDGKCDPAGRFLVGSMAKKPDGTPTGSLYCMEQDLHVRKLLDGLIISNGMGWSPDFCSFYLADSFSQDVWVFDYDLDQGAISNRRVAFRLPDGKGVADGLTVDLEGMVWIAVWDDACILRYDPFSGKFLERHAFPALRTSSCVFGGKEMDELYVTSASVDLKEEDWQEYPFNGALMRLKTGVKGMKSFSFKG